MNTDTKKEDVASLFSIADLIININPLVGLGAVLYRGIEVYFQWKLKNMLVSFGLKDPECIQVFSGWVGSQQHWREVSVYVTWPLSI